MLNTDHDLCSLLFCHHPSAAGKMEIPQHLVAVNRACLAKKSQKAICLVSGSYSAMVRRFGDMSEREQAMCHEGLMGGMSDVDHERVLRSAAARLGSHSTHLLKPSAIHYLYSRLSQGQSWQETKQWSKGGCSNRLEHPLFSTFVPLVRSVTPYVIRILNQN